MTAALKGVENAVVVAVRAIAGSLKEGDLVSVVEWDTTNAVRLDGHRVTGPDDVLLLQTVSALESGGGTDLSGGLFAGYELAQEHFSDDRINRVVLVSDGGANAGITDEQLIAAAAGSRDELGIYMVGVGVGKGKSYNDLLMDTVTDAGKGDSVFLEDTHEAECMFGDRFVNTMDVAARNVAIALELPPGFSIVKTSAEEWSTDPDEVDPQHLAPDDVMVLHNELVSCDPDGLDLSETVTVTVSWEHPTTFAPHSATVTATLSSLLEGDPALLLKGRALVAYGRALDALDSVSSSVRQDLLAEVVGTVDAALLVNAGDPDLTEVRVVLTAL